MSSYRGHRGYRDELYINKNGYSYKSCNSTLNNKFFKPTEDNKMTTEQQLKAELKARFNPEQGESKRTVDTYTLDIMWKLFLIDNLHLHNIQRSAWEKITLENLSAMGFVKV